MVDKAYVVKEEPNYSELEEIIDQIHESNDKLENSDIPMYKNEINSLLTNLKKSNKKYKSRMKSSILSIILSLSIPIGALITLNKTTGNPLMYKTIEYTYTDDNLSQKEKRGNFNNILIKEYGYWNEEKTERINKIYDVSKYTFEDIKDYLNIDLSSLEFDTEIDDNIQNINNEGEKVLIKNVSEKDFSLDISMVYSLATLYISTLSYIFLNAILVFSQLRDWKMLDEEKDKYKFKSHYVFDHLYDNSLYSKKYCYIVYHRFTISTKIEKELRNIDLETLKKYYEEIKEPLNEILSEIEKNNELRNEFVRLFNENAYLLNDPNLLMEKYNETLKEYDLLTDKKYVDETLPELKRILNEGGNNAR